MGKNLEYVNSDKYQASGSHLNMLSSRAYCIWIRPCKRPGLEASVKNGWNIISIYPLYGPRRRPLDNVVRQLLVSRAVATFIQDRREQ